MTHFPPPTTKSAWREQIVAGRRAVDAATRASESVVLARAVADFCRGKSTVGAYVPVGSEPGSRHVLDAMRAVGVRVLLPIAREPGPLRWAEFTGPDTLVSAPFGLTEPEGPVLDPDTIADCDAVLIPALAVDTRGVRLGRGAGFYDRTLDLCSPNTPLVAVVRDDELVSELPEEPHDRRMTHALTPNRGLVALN